MSATSSTDAQLDLIEKFLKIADLQAEAALKTAQTRWEPWKVVASALAAGGVVGRAFVAAMVAILHIRIAG